MAVRHRNWRSWTIWHDGVSFLLGHNLIDFDLPHLAAALPGLRLLKLPAVDTLRLSPLAFPRNPYHRLVKHYQDGGLKRGRVNDPELDSRMALEVFRRRAGSPERDGAGSAGGLALADHPGVRRSWTAVWTISSRRSAMREDPRTARPGRPWPGDSWAWPA